MITLKLLVQGSCGISRPFADPKTLRGYLKASNQTKLHRRLENLLLVDAICIQITDYRIANPPDSASNRSRGNAMLAQLPDGGVHLVANVQPDEYIAPDTPVLHGPRLVTVTSNSPKRDFLWIGEIYREVAVEAFSTPIEYLRGPLSSTGSNGVGFEHRTVDRPRHQTGKAGR